MSYPLFRGIGKPLVLFGLKDRFIYQAIGGAALGLVSAVVLSLPLGFLGMLLGLGLGGGLILWTYKRQDKKGLYQKEKTSDQLLVYPKTLCWNPEPKKSSYFNN